MKNAPENELTNQKETPATVHKAVLTAEVLQWLAPKPGGLYVDATFGSGGHTKAILEHEPTCKVIAIDWDLKAIEQFGDPLIKQFPGRLTIFWSSFALLYKLLKKEGISHIDGILADFGPSQVQLKERAGFSFYQDTALDMRMSPSFFPLTAAELIAKAPEEKLRQLFWQLGEERYAKEIARAIVQQRSKVPITTTGQLASIVEKAVPRTDHKKIHPATRVFQALRIYINRELENIESLLAVTLQIVKPGGRIVCISFHSLEDRIVKQFFHNNEQLELLEILTPKVICASPTEIADNPSARSAKLRTAEIKRNI
jgi:16S rRNA (cytosine1402-N4)-methyltransferase